MAATVPIKSAIKSVENHIISRKNIYTIAIKNCKTENLVFNSQNRIYIKICVHLSFEKLVKNIFKN